ncbi:dTMP kinase [Aureimonas sp. ME7]|uniref:dTMP kinase n=1 Tax=Aureimonas sp. ME7 TaxID=2744252 RepID=UPI001FCE72E5|nr:dTMP kinase [Aureimonas sp. ME7]
MTQQSRDLILPPRGRFVTFEGADGSGKTSQIARLAAMLADGGIRVVTTREPGGSPGADAIREIVLNGVAQSLGTETEAILFAAARYDHIRSLIEPSLASGAFVLCDRFIDSTRAYQGTDPQADAAFLTELQMATVAGLMPDVTFVLDVPLEISLKRTARRRGLDAPDRFEKDDHATQENRRLAFLSIAHAEPERCVLIDASRDEDVVAAEIAGVMRERFDIVRAVGMRNSDVEGLR